MMVVTIAEIDRAQLLNIQKRSSQIVLICNSSNEPQRKNMKIPEGEKLSTLIQRY